MTVVTSALVFLGTLAVVLGGFAALAIRARGRGLGHSFMTPFEDMWDPAAHRTGVVVLAEAHRKAPAPAPGDPPDPGGS